MTGKSRRDLLKTAALASVAASPAGPAAPPAAQEGSHWEKPPKQKVPGNRYAGKRISGLVQIPDVVPTLLGRLNLKPPPRVTGQDLWPFVTGDRQPTRDHVISAFGYVAAVRTPEWNYSAIWNKEKYKGTCQPKLYNRKNDPHELHDVAGQNPSVVRDLQTKLERYISSGWYITRGSFNEAAG